MVVDVSALHLQCYQLAPNAGLSGKKVSKMPQPRCRVPEGQEHLSLVRVTATQINFKLCFQAKPGVYTPVESSLAYL